jgi:NADP-dependent 3-hydroxy acid dehydrogenase YdfG
MTSEPSAKNVAVVTGGARGIGLAVAKWFLAEGYRVALLDIDRETLTTTASQLNEPARVLAIHCDVSHPRQVKEAVTRVENAYGRIDALVNNAGVAVFKPILETTFEEWRHVLATNLDGVFLCTQACAPVMLRNGGGAVVNIASISGLRASTLRVAYGTSKAAIIALTKQQAVERRNSGERDCPRARRYSHGKAGPQRGDSCGLSRCDSAQPLRYSGGNGAGGGIFMQPRRQLREWPGAGRGWRLRCHRRGVADASQKTRRMNMSRIFC